ncbi:hypothetical protein [Bradyrhizobium sp. USDA 4486]
MDVIFAARTSALKSIPQPAAQGGFHFYLDIKGWRQSTKGSGPEFDADDLVSVLLMDAGVAAASGTIFGDPDGVRLSYGIDLGSLDKGAFVGNFKHIELKAWWVRHA